MDNSFTPTPIEEQIVPKKKKLPIVPIVIISVILLAAIGLGIWFAVSQSSLLPKAEKSLNKTLTAIMGDDAELLESISKDGAELSVSGELKKDLIPALKSNTAKLDMTLSFAPDASAANGSASLEAGGQAIGGSVIADESGLAFSSDTLLGDGVYTVAIEGLKDSLKSSVFYPTSGSKYALDSDTYDSILEIVKQLEDPSTLDEEEQALIEDFVKKTSKLLKSNLTTEKQKGMMSLGKVSSENATLYKITFDEQLVYGLIQAFSDELESNGDFADIFAEFVTVPENQAKSKNEYLIDSVNELRKKLTDNNTKFTGSIQYLISDGYMLAFIFELNTKTDNQGYGNTPTVLLRFETSGDPENDPYLFFKLTASGKELLYMEYKTKRDDSLELTEDTLDLAFNTGEMDIEMTLTASTEDNGNLSAKLDIGINGSWIAYSAKGKVTNSDTERGFEITELKLGDTALITESRISVKLTHTKKSEVKTVSEVVGKPLLTMSEADIDGMLATVNESLKVRQSAMNSALGSTLIANKYTVTKNAPFTLHNYSVTAVCYDSYSGYYFTAATIAGHHYIIKNDPERPSDDLSYEVPYPIEVLDAYRGRVAYVLPTNDTDTVIVRDASNGFELIYERSDLDGNKIITDIVLTKNRLVYATRPAEYSSDNVFAVDLGSFAKTKITSEKYYHASLSADRETNIVGICERNTSFCSFATVDMNGSAGSLRHACGLEYNSLPCFYQNGHFLACGEAHSTDCNVVTKYEISGSAANNADALLAYGDDVRALYYKKDRSVVFHDINTNILLKDQLPAPVVDSIRLSNGDILLLAIGGVDDLAYACRYSLTKTDSYTFNFGSIELLFNK